MLTTLRNRTISTADNSGQTSTYTYDADGRRVRRNTISQGEVWQVFGMDGELLAEYSANTTDLIPKKKYVYRSGELIPDHLGTPRIIAERTGSLTGIKRHDYLPFGEEVQAGTAGRTTAQGYVGDNVRQQFANYERDDETDLDYAQARCISSVQGHSQVLIP